MKKYLAILALSVGLVPWSVFAATLDTDHPPLDQQLNIMTCDNAADEVGIYRTGAIGSPEENIDGWITCADVPYIAFSGFNNPGEYAAPNLFFNLPYGYGYGTYHLVESVAGDPICADATHTFAECLASAGFVSDFPFFVPDPNTPAISASIAPGDLTMGTGTGRDVLKSTSNVFGDAGLLSIVVLAVSLPVFFWAAVEIIALFKTRRDREKQ